MKPPLVGKKKPTKAHPSIEILRLRHVFVAGVEGVRRASLSVHYQTSLQYFFMIVYQLCVRVLVCAGTALLMTLWVIACSQHSEPKKTSGNNQMAFEVQRERLGDSLGSQRCGVSIFIPRDWKPLAPEMLEQMRSRIAALTPDSAAFRLQPEYVFAKQQTGVSLTLSRIQFRDTTLSGSVRLQHYTASLLAANPDTNTAKKAEFLKGTIPITQFFLRQQQQIAYKLLFLNARNELIQLDYVLPLQVFEAEIKAVESSIGSMGLL